MIIIISGERERERAGRASKGVVQTRFLSRSTREVPRTHRQNETREDLAASFACRMQSVTKGYRLGIFDYYIHPYIHTLPRPWRAEKVPTTV